MVETEEGRKSPASLKALSLPKRKQLQPVQMPVRYFAGTILSFYGLDESPPPTSFDKEEKLEL